MLRCNIVYLLHCNTSFAWEFPIYSDNDFNYFDLFTTTLQDGDKKNHRLPNTSIVKSHLINYYKNKEINVGFELSISNNNDIDIQTQSVTLNVLWNHYYYYYYYNYDYGYYYYYYGYYYYYYYYYYY